MLEQLDFFDAVSSDDEPIEAEELAFFEWIKPYFFNILESNNIDHKHLVFGVNLDNSAVKYREAESVVFRVRLRKKKRYFEVKNRYSSFMPDNLTQTKSQTDGYRRIELTLPEDPYTCVEALCNVLDAVIDNYPKNFDCCYRYLACSNAKACIHPDRDFSMDCSYKTKMKHGKIFFGKNRNVD